MKTKRKAFTLVELVIVIAVIGILAAVLIPTFSSVIHNANLAKDKATCRNMNEILAVATAGQVETVAHIIAFAEEEDFDDTQIIAVRGILKAGGVSEENFKAATDGYLFLYYPEDNVILLTEGREAIVFPDAYIGSGIDLYLLADLDRAGDPVTPHEHEYNDNRVTVDATCTEKGSVSSTCSVCGKSYYEEIAALGHEYQVKEVKAPTCTTQGYTVYECSRCHDTYNGDETEVIAHTAAEAVRENEVAATCEATGSYDEVVYCSECGEELSRTQKTIEKKDHTPAEAVQENVVPATCEAAGSYDEVVYCSECDEELSRTQKTIEKKDHTPAEAVQENVVPATCEAAGSYDEVVYCSVCEEELSREATTIDALSHDLGEYVSNNDATCAVDGTKTRSCSRCEYEETVTDAGSKSTVAHTYTTYDSNGDNTHSPKCSVCGYVNIEVREDCTFTDGNCDKCPGTQMCKVTFTDSGFNLTYNNGTESLSSGNSVEYGTVLTVSLDPQSTHIIESITVTGNAEVSGETITVKGDITEIAVQTKENVNMVTYSFKFYDTWNQETIIAEGYSIEVPEGTEVNISHAPQKPEYWQDDTTTVTIEGGSIVTFNGERHRTIDSADYTVITTNMGLQNISGGYFDANGNFIEPTTENQVVPAVTKNYILNNDINMDSGDDFWPIGFCLVGDNNVTAYSYDGIFDGNGKTISNLYIDWTANSIGMFSILTGTVRNVNIEATSIYGYTRIGVVAGQSFGATISNVHVTVSNEIRATDYTTDYSSNGISYASAVGGIVGVMDKDEENNKETTVSLCSFTGNVNSYGDGSYYRGTFYPYQYGGSVGGICGIMFLGKIEKSWFEGNLNNYWNASAGGNNIGGIAGAALGTSIIENCHAYLDYINGYDFEGGIVGNASSTVQLKYCWAFVYNGGTWNGDYVGEICPSALNSTVTNCYYTGGVFYNSECPGKGIYMKNLGSGAMPAGFDTSIWAVGTGCPYLIENVW